MIIIGQETHIKDIRNLSNNEPIIDEGLIKLFLLTLKCI